MLEPGRPPEAIAASEAAVAKRLRGVPATSFGVGKRTFDNLRGRVRAAVRLVDLHARRRLKMTSIPPCWREPLEALSPSWRRALWPLVTHAVFRGLGPADVEGRTLDDLEAALERRGDAQPRLRVQRVVYACERLPTGDDTLAALPRRYSPRAASPLGWEELPAAFRQSWERWCGDELARLRAVAPSRDEPDYADLFEDGEQLFAHLFDGGGGEVEGTGLDDAPSRFRAAVTYAAKADARPERLTDFREVLTPRHQQDAVAAVLARQQRRRAPHEPRVEKRNTYAWSIAGALHQLAKWHGVDEQDLADMRLVVLDVDPKVAKLRRDPATGRTRAVYRRGASVMGERHRRQLEAIVETDAAFAAWVEAPDRLWAPVERAIARERVTVRLAYDALVACAHEYIRSAPTRLENFAELRVSGPRAEPAADGAGGGVPAPRRAQIRQRRHGDPADGSRAGPVPGVPHATAARCCSAMSGHRPTTRGWSPPAATGRSSPGRSARCSRRAIGGSASNSASMSAATSARGFCSKPARTSPSSRRSSVTAASRRRANTTPCSTASAT